MNSLHLCTLTFLEVYSVPKLVEQVCDECGANGRSATQHSVCLLQEFRLHHVAAGQEVKDGRHCMEVGDLWEGGIRG